MRPLIATPVAVVCTAAVASVYTWFRGGKEVEVGTDDDLEHGCNTGAHERWCEVLGRCVKEDEKCGVGVLKQDIEVVVEDLEALAKAGVSASVDAVTAEVKAAKESKAAAEAVKDSAEAAGEWTKAEVDSGMQHLVDAKDSVEDAVAASVSASVSAVKESAKAAGEWTKDGIEAGVQHVVDAKDAVEGAVESGVSAGVHAVKAEVKAVRDSTKAAGNAAKNAAKAAEKRLEAGLSATARAVRDDIAAGKQVAREEIDLLEAEMAQLRASVTHKLFEFVHSSAFGGVIGVLIFVLRTCYVLKFPTELRRRGVIKQILVMTLSIFCTVLVYNSIRRPVVEYSEDTQWIADAVNNAICIVLYMALEGVLFLILNLTSDLKFEAAGQLFANSTGFAAMYGWAGLLQSERQAFSSIAVLLGAFVVLILCELVRQKCRDMSVYANGNDNENVERWITFEDGLISLSIGFPLIQMVRFCIGGPIGEPNVTEVVPQHSEANLLLVCVCFAVCMNALGLVYKKAKDTEDYSQDRKRILHILFLTFVIAFAWCVLFWAEWQLYQHLDIDRPPHISSCVIVSIFVTQLSLMRGYLQLMLSGTLDGGTTGLRPLIFATGVFSGLTSQSSFDAAWGNLGELLHAGGEVPPPLRVFLMFLVVVLTFFPILRAHVPLMKT